MLKIGLTGGIGCGKSIVSALFEALKVPVIDADVISRQLVSNNPETLMQLVNTFGDKILTANQSLNREKLREIIFSDAQKKTIRKPITPTHLSTNQNRD